MKIVQVTLQIEDWPEDIGQQADNLIALEGTDVPYGEVVEVEVEEVD